MDDRIEKQNKLAEEVLRLARNTLLVNLRFLDAALNELQILPIEEEKFTVATDGQALAYSPLFVLRKYKEEREFIACAYLHMVFHSVFRHMFVHTLVDHHVWDLACDIAVEYVIAGLGLKAVAVRRDLLQKSVFDTLKKEIRHTVRCNHSGRYVNHIVVYLDRITLGERKKKDDTSCRALFEECIFAQIIEFIKIANDDP